VVIGPTSAKAAKSAGYKSIFIPENGSKGIEAWANLILEVVKNK
jgi:uroporphyrinogen-III synthase